MFPEAAPLHFSILSSLMAGLHSSTGSFSADPMELTSVPSPLKPRAVVASSVSMQKPLRLAKRKNHLRPKILKTLSPKPTPSPVKIETPLTDDVDEDYSSVALPSIAETPEGDEFRASSAVVEESLDLGKFSSNFMVKFGAYLFGAFLFHTICAVWFLGSAGSSSRPEKPKGSELGVDGKHKEKSLIDGNARRGFSQGKVSPETGNAALYLDESGVEKKIQEIRLMAREARRIETKKLKGEAEGSQMEEEELTSKSRIAIEKEIGSRLKKLEKKLKTVKKSPVLSKGVSDSKEPGDGLVFKKKLKYRGASVEKSSQSPKGFGSENHTAAASKGVHNSQELQSDDPDLENGTKKSFLQKEIEVKDTDSKTGPLQQSSQENSLSKVFDSGSYQELSPKKSQSFKSINDNTKKFPSLPISRQKDDTTCFWWLNLPCVFAILMRRGSNYEGPQGLFTLKVASDKDDKNVSSYVIGFEDHVDANKFCYLLESFFEDLGDFSTDIVPLLKKELEVAVGLKTMNVFVLRKEQLRLYAGQPFSDVESDLVSLVKENESAYS